MVFNYVNELPLEGFKIFFANRKPNTIIVIPKTNSTHEYTAYSEKFIFKSPNSPINKKIPPNSQCMADKIHVRIN